MESIVHNQDCMVGMRDYPDNYFDLAVVDPPYGIGIDGQKLKININNPKANRKQHEFKGWDNATPNQKYFDELFRISKNQVIWGVNYFVEYINKGTKGWIVWYKGQDGLTMSDAELAFSSFDSPTRVVKINRVELLKEGTIHPTQKPIKLYEWIYLNYLPDGGRVIDTHLGSGSNRIAADKQGNIDFTGYELDKDYYDAQEKRWKEYKSQLTLF